MLWKQNNSFQIGWTKDNETSANGVGMPNYNHHKRTREKDKSWQLRGFDWLGIENEIDEWTNNSLTGVE